MIKDKLKLIDDKTEFILIGTRPQLEKVQIDSSVVGDAVVSASNEPIMNLGEWFDRNLPMSTHVTKICKAGFFYLYNILSRIRKYVDGASVAHLSEQAPFTSEFVGSIPATDGCEKSVSTLCRK